MALTGAISAILILDKGMPIIVAILAAILVGLIIGIFEGVFIAFVGIPPFIVTFATMLIGRGLTYVALQAQTKGPLPDAYNAIGAGYLPTLTVKVGGFAFDLICVIVSVIAMAILIWSEVRSIKRKKSYSFAIKPTWQTVVKLTVFIVIIWFFMYRLAV